MCFKSRESIVFKAVAVALLSVLLSQGLGTFEAYEAIREVIEESAPNVPKPTNATMNSTGMGFAPMNLTATSNLTMMSPFATMATATTLPRKRQATQRTRPMVTTATPKPTTTIGNLDRRAQGAGQGAGATARAHRDRDLGACGCR
jgi:hypothetical protein